MQNVEIKAPFMGLSQQSHKTQIRVVGVPKKRNQKQEISRGRVLVVWQLFSEDTQDGLYV